MINYPIIQVGIINFSNTFPYFQVILVLVLLAGFHLILFVSQNYRLTSKSNFTVAVYIIFYYFIPSYEQGIGNENAVQKNFL